MLKNILDQAKQATRSLERREDQTKVDEDDTVMVISTFGADRKFTDVTKNIENILRKSNSYTSRRPGLR